MPIVRTTLLVVLLLVPAFVYCGLGAWALWQQGWLGWAWWPLPVCWLSAFLILKYWKHDPKKPGRQDGKLPPHWTDRDEQAWKIVEGYVHTKGELTSEVLSRPEIYTETVNELALSVARHYHPAAKDPFSDVTVPEILAAAQLAFDDLETWVHDYVPGSRMLTVRRWKQLASAPKWAKRIQNLTWGVAVLVNPLNVGKFLFSRWALDPISTRLQTDFITMFYVMFVQKIGSYLIEMNSGRLRNGAAEYRRFQRQLAMPRAASVDGTAGVDEQDDPDVPSEPATVTLAVIGQVKAGKSSVINALLGEARANVDVLPVNDGPTRYELQGRVPGDRLVLLDTRGYGENIRDEERAEALEAASQADGILLVLDPRRPARGPDVDILQGLRTAFAANPKLKLPSVIAVVTHIDGLRPVLEWEPPYDWQQPHTLKEKSIRGAVDYAVETFGTTVAAVVPICAAGGDQGTTGIEEELLPAITAVLPRARAAAAVRLLHGNLDKERLKHVLKQSLNAGKTILQLTSRMAMQFLESAEKRR